MTIEQLEALRASRLDPTNYVTMSEMLVFEANLGASVDRHFPQPAKGWPAQLQTPPCDDIRFGSHADLH